MRILCAVLSHLRVFKCCYGVGCDVVSSCASLRPWFARVLVGPLAMTILPGFHANALAVRRVFACESLFVIGLAGRVCVASLIFREYHRHQNRSSSIVRIVAAYSANHLSVVLTQELFTYASVSLMLCCLVGCVHGCRPAPPEHECISCWRRWR